MVAHGVSRGFGADKSKPRRGDRWNVSNGFSFRPFRACSFIHLSHGSRRGLPSAAPLVLEHYAMKSNAILDEIRRFRDAHAKFFNYDPTAIFEDHRRHAEALKKQGWTFVKPPRRRRASRKLAA